MPAPLIDRFGAKAADVTPARPSYQLATLRGQGVLGNGAALRASSHPLGRALADLAPHFDPLAHLAGLRVGMKLGTHSQLTRVQYS